MEHTQLNILIISEDKTSHQQIIQALDNPDIATFSAFNKAEALEQIKVHEPQFIILDADFSEKFEQNIIQQGNFQSFSSSARLIVTSLGSSKYPETNDLHNWDTGISYAISVQEITQEVEDLRQKLNGKPTNLQKMDGLSEETRRPKVSVVIPTLNEEKNLPHLLPFLPMDWVDEVVLVDGRSTDNTIEVAKQLLPSIVVIEEKRPGKGIAMQTGFYSSIGDIIITLDADGSMDPREIPRMITALLEGADMVKGTRFSSGGGTNDMTLVRKLGNKGLMLLANVLFSASFTDLCYGYHAFWRHCLDYLDLSKQTGFEIDTGMYIQAWRNHLKLVETPSFEGYRFYGYGKLQTFKDGWRVLKQIIAEKQAQLSADPQEEYMGFRGARPKFLHPPAYKKTFNDLYQVAFSRDFFLPNGDPYLTQDADFYSRSFTNARSLFQILYQAANTLSQSDYLDFEKLLGRILKQVVHVLDASSGSIVILDENGEPAKSYNIYNSQVFPVPAEQLPETLDNSLAGWVIKNRQPALLTDTAEDNRWAKRPWEVAAPQSRSALSVPLKAEDSVVGVLTLARPQVREFTLDDLRVASNMIG